jgi:acetate---CoA ligase (ADP-forming) subunit beta
VSTIDLGARDVRRLLPIQPSADVATLVSTARAQRRNVLSEPEAKAFLQAHGIPVPPGRVVRTADEAPAAVDAIGPPVVVKAVAHQLPHKTEAGAVIFPVDSPASAQAACRTIAARLAYRQDIVLEGFLLEAYRPAQPEWIVALRNDPHFGPVVMVGLGGIYVETLRQVSFRLAPLRSEDIEALLSERPATRLLAGARGAAPRDRRAVVDVLRALSDLSQQPAVAPEISEIEINPLAVTESGALALDALIVLRS